jgi:hypothetical protein
MLARHFLLGRHKVFQFGRAVFDAGVFRVVVAVMAVCVLVMRNQAHHRPMMVVRHCGERHQQESGDGYGQYVEFTFQR